MKPPKPEDLQQLKVMFAMLDPLIDSENLKSALATVQTAVEAGQTPDMLLAATALAAVNVAMVKVGRMADALDGIAKALGNIGVETELLREGQTALIAAVNEVAIETGGHRQR